MAVAFDAVGPSSAGTASATSPLTWSHVNGGNAIVVGVTIFNGSSNTVTAVTYGGVALSLLGFTVSGSGGAGGVALYGLAGGTVPTGTNTVSVSFSDGANHNAGSISFTGAATLGTPVTGIGTNTASVTANVAGTTSGNMIAATCCYGGTALTTITGTNSVTTRVEHNGGTSTGADNGASGTVASAGGTQTVGFTDTGTDFWGIVAVEVQAGGGGGAASPGLLTARPGKTWRRKFRHAQHLPLQPPPPAPVLNIAAPAAVATGAAGQPVFSTYIAGLGGSGAGYFKDQSGKPRMWLGDEIWALITNAGRWNSGNYQATFDAYFATRAAQGFTICYSDMFNSTFIGGATNGQNWAGQTPFTSNNPSSGLNNTYWQVIDYALSAALANGITIALSFGGHWDWDVSGNAMFGFTGTQYSDAGNAIGTRYKAQANLIWLIMDDYFGSFDSSLSSLLTGLRASGDTHPIAIENYAETSSRFDLSTNGSLSWGASNTQYNFGYSYSCSYLCVEYMYAESSPLTPIYGDGYFYQGGSTYQGGTGAGALDRAIRQDAWWAVTSGARGFNVGDEALWQWPSGAPAAVSTQWYAANNTVHIRAVMEGLTGWETLAPDTSSVLVTGGRGTRGTQFSSGGGGGQYEPATTNSFVSAARTPDSGSGSSLAVMYLPNATTITIDQTKMVSGYTATWVDPVSGATSSATVGSTYNSTAKGNNSKGDPDWVLVLQASTGTTVNAGIPTATGTAPQPAVTVSVLAGIPTATGTAPQPAASVSAKAGIPAATGTAPGPVPAISALAGTATATGTAPQPAASPSVTAGIPTATGTQAGPVPAIAVLPGIPVATGVAPAPSIQTAGTVNINAPAVTATGTAPQPVAAIAVLPGIPAATGTAPAPAPAPSVLAGLAAATGAAPQPAAAISVKPGIPVATGTVLAPSILSGQVINAPAVTATGTAAAPVPAASIFAGLAAATGFAPPTAHGVLAGIPAATGGIGQPGIAASIFPVIPAAAGTAPPAQAQSVIPAVFARAATTGTILTPATPGGTSLTPATPGGTALATATPGGQP